MAEWKTQVQGVADVERGGYSLWDITLGDGRKYSTFDEPLADIARDAKRNNTIVKVNTDTVTKTGRDGQPRRYNNLLAIEATDEQGEAPEAVRTAPTASQEYQREKTPAERQDMRRANALNNAFAYAAATGLDVEAALDIAKQIMGFENEDETVKELEAMASEVHTGQTWQHT